MSRKALIKNIDNLIEKCKNKNYWNIIILNRNTILNNFNYSCVFYAITHYAIFTKKVCNQYKCCHCNRKATTIKFDYIKRAKLINIIIDEYEKQSKYDDIYLTLNNIICNYLLYIKDNIDKLLFTCCYCSEQDYPSYKEIETNVTKEHIIDNANKIKYDTNNNKWKLYKIDINKLKINNI